MVDTCARETSIAHVRVVRGLFGNRVEIARALCRLGMDGEGKLYNKPCGIGVWRKARASDMPELAVWLSEADACHSSH